MLELLTPASVCYAVAFIALAWFLQKLHFQRSLLNGLPSPPRNYFLGSLISMGKVLAKQPRNAAPQTYMHCLKEFYQMGDVLYFDPWPMGYVFNVHKSNV